MFDLLAAALLLAPPGTPEPMPDPGDWPELQAAIHARAVAEEWMDQKEKSHIMARLDDFEKDLDLLRRRAVDLADAPRVSESRRFPCRRQVQQALSFNREYRRRLELRAMLETDRGDEIREAIRETDAAYRIWDACRDSQCGFYFTTVRRAALLRLREAIGEEDFRAGVLPDYVPVWRFAEVRLP